VNRVGCAVGRPLPSRLSRSARSSLDVAVGERRWATLRDAGAIGDTGRKSLTALGLGDPSDPTNVAAYGKELATVQETSPGHFQGTLDITKAPLPSITAPLLAQAGDALKSVPFEATTDGQDRLVSITIKLPSLGPNVPASTTTVTFSAFGTPVNIQPPSPSETEEAPAIVYQGLGG
jgi:hypothetical protein